jgi:membrane protease subunit HflK
VLNNDSNNGPWGNRGGGSGGGGEGGGNGGGDGPRNPWNVPPPGKRPGPGGPTALDELLKRAKGGMPRTPGGKSFVPLALLLLAGAWLFLTAVHRIAPQERGVILRLGNYAGTLNPGIGFTAPWPIDTLEKIDVEEIRTIDIAATAGSSENLMLTEDQNIIDLQYSVRWNIRDPERYLFQLADPDESVRETAESAMRAVVATVRLDEAIGSGRGDIEQRVQRVAQQMLDEYRSGVSIQGIAIKQADPPAAVLDAFKSVSAAQQTAQTYLNEARAYSQQLTARAQGEAAAFDKVYQEYTQAPEVTRRRMYYETMEKVLSKVDKTIVETDGVTPYLPLDQVRRRQQATPAAPAAPAPEAAR